jgi:hypothetical protein
MKKFYKGSLFSQNMWTTAKSFTSDKYDYHMSKIEEKSHDALDWLDYNHPHIWNRSKYLEECKVDYITNNLWKVSIVGWQKSKTCILCKCLTT